RAFGGKARPRIAFGNGAIEHDGGENKFPHRLRCQQTLRQPVPLSSVAELVAVEHRFAGTVRVGVGVALTARIEQKEISLSVGKFLPSAVQRNGIDRKKL